MARGQITIHVQDGRVKHRKHLHKWAPTDLAHLAGVLAQNAGNVDDMAYAAGYRREFTDRSPTHVTKENMDQLSKVMAIIVSNWPDYGDVG